MGRIATCVNILDKPEIQDWISDATQLSNIVEAGEEISKEEFERLSGIEVKRSKGLTFWKHEEWFLWKYNERTDIHTFYEFND